MSPSSRTTSFLTAIAIGLATGFVTAISTGIEAATASSAAAAAAAPPKLEGIDVRTMAPSKLALPAKRPTVLVFISSKCPCSMSHIPELRSLALEFSDVQFVGIHSNFDESLEIAHPYFKSADLSFPILRDEGMKLADHFKAAKTPHAFVIGPDGQVLFQGGVSDSSKFPQADRKYLREALEDLKNQIPIRTKVARALGCAITRPNN